MLPLVCIDVDGTLVGPSGFPTDAVWAAADAAVARGQHLALSTARAAMGSTLDYARRLDADGWHVFHVGAALVHAGTGETRETPLADATLQAAIDLHDATGWTLEFYGAASYAVTDASQRSLDHADLMGVPLRHGGAAAIDGAVVRVQFVITPAELGELEAVFTATFGAASLSAATSPVMPGTTFASILATGVSKSAAIARIAAELGTTMDNVMMVGDGHNDLDAIRAVGHGVAMGNAEPEVKAAARYHVAPVTDDGLAEALAMSAELG